MNEAGTAKSGGVIHEAKLFLTALQYFTRVPAPAWVGHSASQLEGAVRYFPAIGMLVAAVGAAVLLLTQGILPAPLPVILSTAATIWMTGAFHEDGLADTFDGLGGGATPERALQIMKDSRLGTYATLALVLIVLLKIFALNAMPDNEALLALLAAHPLSRWCAVTLIWRQRYARSDSQSRARPMATPLSTPQYLLASVFGLLPAAVCGLHSVAAMALPLLVLGCLARWFNRRLGGYTGDTLGATQQITEIAFYLALLASWKLF